MNTIIITAGGIGSRMGGDVPKQYITVGGEPILMRTMNRFIAFDPKIQIIITLPEAWMAYWKELCEKHNFVVLHQIVMGGQERFHSIANALKVATGDVIGVHDGVRPFVSIETIKNCFETASRHGTAVPFLPVLESIRKLKGDLSYAVNRKDYVCVQTPQCFSRAIILKAYEQEYMASFTDDASVVENDGEQIELVLGNQENIKITSPLDLKIAELFV